MGEIVWLVVLGRLLEFRNPTETVHSQGYPATLPPVMMVQWKMTLLKGDYSWRDPFCE